VTETIDLRGCIAGDYNDDTTVPVFIKCIFHHDRQRPNLAVYYDHVYCFTCGKYMAMIPFLVQYWRKPYEEVVDTLRNGDFPKVEGGEHDRTLPPVDPSLVQTYQEALYRNPAALSYLHGRGLSKGTIEWAKLGHSGSAFTIPVFDTSHACTNIRFRRDDTATQLANGPKYWSLPGRRTALYGIDRIKPGIIIVLTEGEFDSLIATQLGYCGVSFTNGKNAVAQDALPYLAEGACVVIAYDQDKASAGRGLELAPILAQQVADIRIAQWPLRWGKDLSEVFVSMGDKVVEEIITRARRRRGNANPISNQRRGLAAAVS